MLIVGMIFIIIVGFFLYFINQFVEPILRQRLNTLITTGSDSLYHYRLGDLKINFYGGKAEVTDLNIWVDSSRYFQLKQANALPALTIQMELQRGYIKGLGLLPLILGRQILVSEIMSKEANIKLYRHVNNSSATSETLPLWKAIQPVIKSIAIKRIKLNGIKLLYKNADTSESVKLQFDRCDALFKNIRVDSLAETDPDRIAFTKEIILHLNDLKFRTPDSTYKLKAEHIRYSSVKRTLEIEDFKLQPTLKKEEFYKHIAFQQSMYFVEFKNIRFSNLYLEKFINENLIMADSVLISEPEIAIYNDKTLPKEFANKIGRYPHQMLLRTNTVIDVKGIRIENAALAYTEKSQKTLQEGKLSFKDINVFISNVTNDARLIKENSLCTAVASARLFDSSRLKAHFQFYLDSVQGAFSVSGEVDRLNAAQLNRVSQPLANAEIQTLNIQKALFTVQGDDYSTRTNMQMWYNNFSVILRKRDDETGANKTKKFISKLLNKYTLYPSNPDETGTLRRAHNVLYARVSTKPFFAVIWTSIYRGMQDIMMKNGRYD